MVQSFEIINATQFFTCVFKIRNCYFILLLVNCVPITPAGMSLDGLLAWKCVSNFRSTFRLSSYSTQLSNVEYYEAIYFICSYTLVEDSGERGLMRHSCEGISLISAQDKLIVIRIYELQFSSKKMLSSQRVKIRASGKYII